MTNCVIPDNELYKMLVDASIDRVMAIDTAWRIISWNNTSQIVTGVQQVNVLHNHLFDAFPELQKDPELVAAIEQAMEGRKIFLPSDDRYAHRAFYENHFIPLLSGDNRVAGVMNIMHDVSHRIKKEQELQRLNGALKAGNEQLQKANDELSVFTSLTGNDLKEPVKKLYTGLEMLVQSEGHKLTDSSKANLRRMQASLTKVNLLLDDILKFSAASSFSEKFQPLQLEAILQRALEKLQPKIIEKNAVIRSGPFPAYFGSKEMLEYLFVNLIDNALKFQHQGNIPVIDISFKKVAMNNSYCISFSDNGIGFNPEDSRRIFNMFERLHARKEFPGAGIGLTICQKMAQAHGGHIEAESNGKSGAIFHCYLPATCA